jgi:activator of HSP90 ATPase
MSKPIHQEVVIKATPKQVYELLTTSAQFSQMSGGAPTEISPDVGGAFSNFGGQIVGRNIELLPGQRVVQAWRAKTWEPGVYSVARFELQAQGSETKIVFDHSSFPEGQGEHLAAGWEANYWEPMRKYLSAKS